MFFIFDLCLLLEVDVDKKKNNMCFAHIFWKLFESFFHEHFLTEFF
jgi:hypothetical protein